MSFTALATALIGAGTAIGKGASASKARGIQKKSNLHKEKMGRKQFMLDKKLFNIQAEELRQDEDWNNRLMRELGGFNG